MSENLVTLLLKLPRNTNVTPESAQTFLSALTQINPPSTSILNVFRKSNTKPIALEIVLIEGQIHFQLTCDVDVMPFIETQIHSNYPLTAIEKVKDPLIDLDTSDLQAAYLKLNNSDYYPLSTYTAFKDVDPLNSLLSVLSKAPSNEFAMIQFALEPANRNWQSNGMQFAEYGEKNEDGSYKPRPDAHIIKEKISLPGFMTSVRIASTNLGIIQATVNAFEVFKRVDGNSFAPTYPTRKKLEKEIKYLKSRKTADKQVLNIAELATLWHLPSEKIKTPSIVWGSSVLSEPPANLPIATDLTEEEKRKINFFAKTTYKNKETIFGIKDKDRLRHIWVVGKTGTGKSTMIANMAIDDAKKGRGMAIVDPHGDLCEDILNYIPSNRINDTVYFNPADRNYPISINPLEVTNREEAELVVAGLMSIFTKVWANVWSARMEYILRNTFMTLTEIPNSTLADVLKLLSNKSYRNKVVAKLQDRALIHFWKDEFDAMPEKLQKEAISPIQNKVGQFITSPMIRRIVDTPKSSISIDQIMDEQKILLINLSQGRLGEDNAALLGAMMITKFQLAAMHRVDTPKEQRVPFYLYVDEFQNFATNSFIKILSEARKYGLGLLLANQYMAQIPESITKAILGNAGSMVSFAVGADDARIFHKEFAEVFTENDLVNLENYQIAIKLMIDSHSTRPFVAYTLPLPSNANQNKEKIIRVSRERWAKNISNEKNSRSQDKNQSKDTQPDKKSFNPDTTYPSPPTKINSRNVYQSDNAHQTRGRTHHNKQTLPQKSHTKTIQGEKEMMGERGFENKEAGPQKVRNDEETTSHKSPPDNYPNAPRIPAPTHQNTNEKTQQPYSHPLTQGTVQQSYSPFGTTSAQPAQPRTNKFPNPINQTLNTKKQPQTMPQSPQITQQSQPAYPPRTTPQAQNRITQQPQAIPTGSPPPRFPQPTWQGTPPYPGRSLQYPPPRPAFDADRERREREEKQAEDKAKLAELMKQLEEIKNSQ